MTEKGKYRVCGALAGTVNGLFGGGGGIPLAFLLRSWAKLSDKTALATCVAVIFPFCLVSVLVYALRGALPLGEALPYLVGGLAGGWIGGRLFKDVPNTWLKRIFALFPLVWDCCCALQRSGEPAVPKALLSHWHFCPRLSVWSS